MATHVTHRPRDVNALRAAAILYGDWGTSKAYVIGLAFALAAYSSFWYILAVCILSALVGINYITICRLYPSGGGVYSSVRQRSQILSLVGAFFLIADYIVTAALSAISSFHYLGVSHPEIWAISAIFLIGLINFLGPKHTGSLAFIISVPTVIMVVLLGILSLPHLPDAIHNTQKIHVPFPIAWENFVGIIVALSGIEAIANTTGVMKLNPGTTNTNPLVTRTSTPAILMVMFEVCLFTSLFGLAMNALPGLQAVNGEVNAPGYPDVRDAMLRYMSQTFASSIFGANVGYVFGVAISVVFCVLLLSAVNTAMMGLIALLFVLSRDGEIPYVFQRLNGFGVPKLPLAASTLAPIFLILFVSDVAGLADLYAVGFVGAIATNLGATSTNYKLDLKFVERYFMMGTFILMAVIEATLLVDKPHARAFVLSLVAFGILLRSLVKESREKKIRRQLPPSIDQPKFKILQDGGMLFPPLKKDGGMVCAVTQVSKALDFALKECKEHKMPLHILFVREQRVLTELDSERLWTDDDDAAKVFDYIIDASHNNPISFQYLVSDFIASSIVNVVEEKKVKSLIISGHRRRAFTRFIRGNIIREIARLLPKGVDMVVVY